MYTPAKMTPEETEAAQVARVGFMTACPFYCHYFYSEMREMATRDVDTAATDGRTIFYNPGYLLGLKPMERVFVFAHEVDHAVGRHPSRAKYYMDSGNIDGIPYDARQANTAMDYVVNAGLLSEGIGMMNPSWLFDPETTGGDLWEDVYKRIYKQRPPSRGRGNPPGRCPPGKTYGGSGRAPRGAKEDAAANAAGGAFDTVIDPPIDPATGKVDLPDAAEFREAVARAAAAAKAMGNMPGRLQRMVDEILDPQVDWREHVRLCITGRIGARRETWDRPNRRRLALNPIIILPGRSGHGAGTVAVVVDNSGSIAERELSTMFAEVGGVIADVRPKEVVLIWCDARVQQVDRAASLDELASIRVKGSPGGGGTDFNPPFAYLEAEDIKPDTLIYMTDMEGRFPDKPPAYPVIWCAISDKGAPWGDVVRVRVA